MNGAGNDFVLLGPAYASLRPMAPSLARGLCPRRTSVGADGLILVDASGGLFMHYFNSDGTEASFCGNGARCFVLFCHLKEIAKGRIEFMTGSGRHIGEVVAGGVRISMPPAGLHERLSLEVGGRRYEMDLVSAGVPHAVILLGPGENVDVDSVGSKIRSHPALGAQGANVDFVSGDSGNGFSIRTYERGVESETLACGSGCIAAAHALRERGLAGDVVTLRVASGEMLTVEQARTADRESYLMGPAVMVFDGYLDIDPEGIEHTHKQGAG